MAWRPRLECSSAADLRRALGETSAKHVEEVTALIAAAAGHASAASESPIGLALKDVACPAECAACCAVLGDDAADPLELVPTNRSAEAAAFAAGVPVSRQQSDVESYLGRLLRRHGPALLIEHCALDGGSVAALSDALRRCAAGPENGDREEGAAEEADDEPVVDFDLFFEESSNQPTVAGRDGAEGDAAVASGTLEAPSGLAPKAPTGAEGAASATAMPEAGVLCQLAVRRCQGVPSTAWVPLWQALPRLLVELDLTGNALSDHAVGALCGALQQRGLRLANLVLKGNHCKDLGRLCALVEGGQLHKVDLSENMLNDKSAAQLGEALGAPEAQLRRLALSENRRISSRGILHLLPPLRRGALKALHLDGTSLCDEGAFALATEISETLLVEELLCHLTRVTPVGARSLLKAARCGTSGLRHLAVDDGIERVHWRRCSEPADVLRFARCGGFNAQEHPRTVATF